MLRRRMHSNLNATMPRIPATKHLFRSRPVSLEFPLRRDLPGLSVVLCHAVLSSKFRCECQDSARSSGYTEPLKVRQKSQPCTLMYPSIPIVMQIMQTSLPWPKLHVIVTWRFPYLASSGKQNMDKFQVISSYYWLPSNFSKQKKWMTAKQHTYS